jgi:hypothetical protein
MPNHAYGSQENHFDSGIRNRTEIEILEIGVDGQLCTHIKFTTIYHDVINAIRFRLGPGTSGIKLRMA